VLAAYASVIVVGWPLVQRRAQELNAAGGPGDEMTPALVQTALGFGVFGLVALVAITLCWRRQGVARLVVLLWPMVMLATPEIARLLPGPWVWMACTAFGVMGAAVLAGPDVRSRQDLQ
jgi:hypothetical protein